MFYKKLTKKTRKNQRALRYKLIFWNQLYGVCDAPITHKLDYIPEQWLVFGFSSLHKSLVYDTQSLCQYNYNTLNCLNLQIGNMAWDYDQLFPTLERNAAPVKREYKRIQRYYVNNSFDTSYPNKVIFQISCPFYNVFLATNSTFVRRRLLQRHKNPRFFVLANKPWLISSIINKQARGAKCKIK